jgi:hypothetical protein
MSAAVIDRSREVLHGSRRFWGDAFVPGLGFLFCLGIWLGLVRISHY